MRRQPGVFLEPLDVRARERLYSLLEAFKRPNPLAPATVVVPSTYAGLSLRHDLGRQGLANVRFMAAARVSELLGAARLAAKGRRPLTPLLEGAAVRATAAQASGILAPFGNHPSLHRSLRSTFRELRHVTPEARHELARLDGLRADLVKLYRRFREHTAAYYDREDLAVEAAQAVLGGAAPGLNDLGAVVFFLVRDLTPGELALVEALARNWTCAAVLGLTGDEEADRAVHSLAGRLSNFLNTPKEGASPTVPKSSDLAPLPVGVRQGSRLVIAPDPQQEVRWTIRHIVRHAQQGTPLHQMAVLYRQPAPYAALLREELGLAGIPAAGPGGVTLSDTAVGRTLAGLVQLADGELTRDNVMALLTGCPVRAGFRPAPTAPGLPPSAFRPARWDVVSRRAGVVKGPAQWQERLERHARGMERAALEGLEREELSEAQADRMNEEAMAALHLAAFVTDLAERVRPPRQGSPWVQFSRWARELRDDPLLPDRERHAAGGADVGLPLGRSQHSQERYTYLAALATAPYCVLSFPRANPGNQRGQFPSRWFLEEASRLAGQTIYTSTLPALGSQPWLTVIASVEESLSTVALQAPADPHDYDLYHLWRWQRAGRPITAHHLANSASLARAFDLERHRAAAALTHWDGDVSALAGRARRLRLLERPVLSATSLEQWATCPFRYFLGHVLGIAALERPEEVIAASPLEKGALVHRILEQFLRAVAEQDTMPAPGEAWSSEHRDLLLQIAHQAFQEAEARGVTGKALLWEIARDSILENLDAFLEEDSRLRAQFGVAPHQVEVSFGTGGLPPVSWDVPGLGVLRFRGKVDRVDMDPSGRVALVLDYKTGSTHSYEALKKDAVAGGRRLQLPLYALAVQSALGQDVQVRSAYWFVSSQGRFVLLPTPPAEVPQAGDRFSAAVTTIAEGISLGLFPANPGGEDRDSYTNCRSCSFNVLCHSQRDVSWQRKQADLRLSAYVGLTASTQAEEEAG